MSEQIKIPPDEIGMSGYSKLAWEIWEETNIPMAICVVIDQIVREQGYRKQEVVDANSATPTSEWISIEDRLPEPLEDVLVVDKNGDVRVDFRLISTQRFVYGQGYTHWMPLPEAPKGGSE